MKLFALVIACGSMILTMALKNCEILNTVANPSPNPDAIAPEKFNVLFDTNVILSNGKPAEPIVLEVNRSWAPLGVLFACARYNQAGFFRVVPDFILQFGIAALPEETAKWNTIILDDPVVVSNTNWTVSYATAAPDTRTTQIFIDYVDNSRLDAYGFAPFAKVISGFDTALAVCES